MQSLIKCSKRQYAVPRRLLSCCFQNDIKKYTVFNTVPCINFDSTTDRLRIPVSHHTYKEIRKEFNALQSVLLKHGITRPQHLLQFCSTRNYSTPSDDRKNDPSKSSGGKDDEKKGKDEEVNQLIHKTFLLLTVIFSIALMARKGRDSTEEMMAVSWNEFAYHMLAKGEVAEVIVKPVLQRVIIILHPGAVVKGKMTNFNMRYMDVPDIENFEEKVRKLEESLGIKFGEGLQITYERSDEFVLRIVSFLLMCFLIYAASRFVHKIRVESMNILSPLTKPKYTLVDPKSGKGVRFEDIAGLREAKIEIMEFVDYFKNPQRYKALGAKVPKGVLLLGPPGCGKTLLAKAVATEANVAFFSMNGSEFIEMIGGLGALRVRHLFKAGKKSAPSIIYIDEIDAIGKKRSSSGVSVGVSENDQTLNQLLVEMDGIMTNEDTIVLASTNRADVLDKALLRPGRFNRHILIDLPTVEERKQIFETHLKHLSLEGKPSEYSEYLSYLTPGFSGADIANVCNEAALHAARDKKKKVDSSDLMYAIDRTVGGVVKKTSSMTAHEKKCVAYHEAGHALVGWLLKYTDALLKITIAPRTNSSLGFSQYIESSNRLQTKEEIFDKMCMIMGGRVAEHVIFNKISTGAQDDLQKVTKLAYGQVQQFGMSPTVGLLAFNEEYTNTKTRKPYSKSLANLMDAEVRKIVGEAYRTTEKVLRENKDKLHIIAEELLKRETLTYDDVEKLIGPPPYEKKRQLQPTNFDKSTTDAEPKTPEPVPT